MIGCLEITTTIPCTNMCSYCPQSLLIKRYGQKNNDMTFETFSTCAVKLPKDKIDIHFSGYAEPFQNKKCIDFILHGKSLGFRINLNTTLVGLSLEHAKILTTVDLNHICLHLPDDLGHMRCEVNDEYIEVLQLLLRKFPRNYAHVYGPLHSKLVPYVPHCNVKPLSNDSLHTRANNVQTNRINLKPHNWKSGKLKCGPILRAGGDIININVLLPNGDVTLCCMDYGLKHKLGNLLTDSYESLFLSEEYKRVEAGLEDETIDILCRTCAEAYQV